MNLLFSILFAVLIAGVGCSLSAHFIPGGTPLLIAQVCSVAAGFGALFGGNKILGG